MRGSQRPDRDSVWTGFRHVKYVALGHPHKMYNVPKIFNALICRHLAASVGTV